jgi:hypothetical protein
MKSETVFPTREAGAPQPATASFFDSAKAWETARMQNQKRYRNGEFSAFFIITFKFLSI